MASQINFQTTWGTAFALFNSAMTYNDLFLESHSLCCALIKVWSEWCSAPLMLHFIKYELRVHTQTAVHVCLFSFFFLRERLSFCCSLSCSCSFPYNRCARGWNSPLPCSLLSSRSCTTKYKILLCNLCAAPTFALCANKWWCATLENGEEN